MRCCVIIMMNRRLAVLNAHLLRPALTAGAVVDFSIPAVTARLEKASAAGLVKCEPITPRDFGAVVSLINLKNALSAEQIGLVYDALLKYQVLVFHADFAPNTHSQQVRFTKELSTASPSLGPPTIGHTVFGHVKDYPEILQVYAGPKNWPLNIEKYKANNVPKHPWSGYHCDITACVNPPCIGMLRGDIIPADQEVGVTMFGSLTAAYEGLSEELKHFIGGRKGEHFFAEGGAAKSVYAEQIRSRKMVSHHPLAALHPDTRLPFLYNSPGFLKRIVGVEGKEGQELLERIHQHSVRSEYTLSHKWTQGDLVLWDERCTAHKAPNDVHPSGMERNLYRSTLLGSPLQGVDGSLSELIEGLPMLSAEEELTHTHAQGRPSRGPAVLGVDPPAQPGGNPENGWDR